MDADKRGGGFLITLIGCVLIFLAGYTNVIKAPYVVGSLGVLFFIGGLLIWDPLKDSGDKNDSS